jgi:hypothetical protein
MKVVANFKFIPQFDRELPKMFRERKCRNFQWQELKRIWVWERGDKVGKIKKDDF